jgi:hypothetical protein
MHELLRYDEPWCGESWCDELPDEQPLHVWWCDERSCDVLQACELQLRVPWWYVRSSYDE